MRKGRSGSRTQPKQGPYIALFGLLSGVLDGKNITLECRCFAHIAMGTAPYHLEGLPLVATALRAETLWAQTGMPTWDMALTLSMRSLAVGS